MDENHESHYQTRLVAFKLQTGLRLMADIKENRKKIKMPAVIVQ
jgi:hypothetical protein